MWYAKRDCAIWCRSLKSKIIERKDKTWRLSIVEEEPKVMEQVDMTVCRDISKEHRNKIKLAHAEH